MQASPVFPQVPAALGSHASLGTSPAGQQYYPTSPQSGERHQPHLPMASSGSPSSRRTARRASGANAAQANKGPSTPQSPQAMVMNGLSPADSNSTTPRNLPLPPSKQISPILGSDGRETMNTYLMQSDSSSVQPPPRGSSQHTSSPSSSRKPARRTEDRPTSSRPTTAENRRDQNHFHEKEPERPRDTTATAAAQAARSRRKASQPRDDSSPRPSASTDARRTYQSPRTEQARSPVVSQTASAMERETLIGRESSTIINSIALLDLQDDLSREHERQTEARPKVGGTYRSPTTGLGLVGESGVDGGGRSGPLARQDHSASAARRKETRFGEYILGQTLGEGEFGKVKMGWKKEGGVQVAIKLLRRDSLGSNPTRLPKIYREIAILRELSHPNIVRLHEMVETERHIGIILEYASGGELFDYILNHRYLKDNAARRLFAQLVSGVGYLHKKGIVHRDLKLENLLLDRNRNIIITDFGFANTFDPADELGDEIEFGLANRDFVRRQDLERVNDKGYRRGDLMQTSCGSPCYAAPELVVSDSLYTGRKVDVWSCGVILYAMLAGYLPFDDDPANPEGDNINLLYKYIVSTPLTFPEYVTPHARDLLRRILVPDPRKRADLFEVARHSWLSDFAHVVSFITSSTTTTGDISNKTVTADDHQDAPSLARSASVREPSKTYQSRTPAIGGLSQKHKRVDQDYEGQKPKTQRDAKRRTVQVEYVAPQSQTSRGDSTPVRQGSASTPTTRARPRSRGAEESASIQAASTTKTVPDDLPPSHQTQSYQNSPIATRSQHSTFTRGMDPASQSDRGGPRSVSDSIGAFGTATIGHPTTSRPSTGGSMNILGSRPNTMDLPSRASYSRPGQPVAPTVATTNAQGRVTQPKNGKQYIISGPIPQSEYYIQDASFTRPSSMAPQPRPSVDQRPVSQNVGNGRGHKRSNTVGGLSERLFGRTGSVFSGSKASRVSHEQTSPQQRSYPPTSMQNAMPVSSRRPSTDSHRSTSFGFGRKSSNLQEKQTRRFSLLSAFSTKNYSSGGGGSGVATRDPTALVRTPTTGRPPGSRDRDRPTRSNLAFGRGASPESSRGSPEGRIILDGYEENVKPNRASMSQNNTRPISGINAVKRRQPAIRDSDAPFDYPRGGRTSYHAYASGPSGPVSSDFPIPNLTESELALTETYQQQSQDAQQPSMKESQQMDDRRSGPYPPGFNSLDDETSPRRSQAQSRTGPGARGPSVLQKNHRRFADAYEGTTDMSGRFPVQSQSSGSSGAARKVMDFFRRRGKARAGD